jgi:molybdate transport system regulatory protein
MIQLLDAIKETGNVRKACESMGMSYSKGWKLLKGLETWLEYPITVRQQGGKGGGEAHLTEEGQAFLKTQRAFEADCEAAVQKLFEKYFL